MELTKYTININASLLDVLKKIGQLTDIQTVFVVDNNNKVIATITDGDIRRGLVKGLGIDNPIVDFMFEDFHLIKKQMNERYDC